MSQELTRLNVNLNQETAAALKELAVNAGSLTEAIRRAVSIHKFLRDEMTAGRKIHTLDQDGRNVREVVMM